MVSVKKRLMGMRNVFQTYYRLDPWRFEPPLKDFGAIQFDDPKQMFSLFMRYIHVFSEDEEPQVLVQTIHRKDDIPDSVRVVPERQKSIGVLERESERVYKLA